MNKILIAEDSKIDRELLEAMLSDKYEIEAVEDGEQAIKLIENNMKNFNAILLDINMPKMKGNEVLERLSQIGVLDKIPVLIITGEESIDIEKECFKLGASDFIRKPFDFYIVSKRIDNIVDLYELRHDLEKKVNKQMKAIKQQYKLLKFQTKRVKQAKDKIAEVLGTIVESRDYQDGSHIKRVKLITEIIANSLMEEFPEYGLTPEKVGMIKEASALHDIGKISIPDSILFKAGKLTKDEEDYMKSHTLRGCELYEHMENVWSEEERKIGYNICRNHHERYDGKGYPDRLKGEDIPIEAQIVSIADAFDNLVNETLSNEAIPFDDAYYMVISGECGVFSPKLLECFRLCKGKISELK